MRIKSKAVFVIVLAAVLALTSIWIYSVYGMRSTIKIGFSANLTGRNSVVGVSGRNGLKMAIDEINRSGGIKGKRVEAVIKDDEASPEKAAEVDRELIEQGAQVIIGHLVSSALRDTLPYINDSKVVMLSPTISSEALSGIDDYFIKLNSSNKRQAEQLAELAINQHGLKRLAALYDLKNREYTEELSYYFSKRVKDLGCDMIYSSGFLSGYEADLKGLAEAIAKSEADGVLVVAAGMDAAIFYQHMQRLRPGFKVYCGMWSATDELIENGTLNMENIYVISNFDVNSDSISYSGFRDAYWKLHSSEPTFSSISCYEAMYILKQAIDGSNSIKGESIREALLNIKEFNGLQQSFRIDKYGDSDKSFQIFTVRNNSFERVF